MPKHKLEFPSEATYFIMKKTVLTDNPEAYSIVMPNQCMASNHAKLKTYVGIDKFKQWQKALSKGGVFVALDENGEWYDINEEQ